VQLSLRTTDGVSLRARWWSTTKDRQDTAVVLVHGFTSSVDDPALVKVAETLSTEGHDVLAYTSRGHPGSEGLCTLGDRERLDVAAAVSHARTRASRVVVLGASMGAIAALRYAATDPSLAGVVSLSAPAVWRFPWRPPAMLGALLSRTRFGRRLAARFLGVRIHPRWDNPPPPGEVAKAITVPTAVVHGTADRVVAASEARVLAASTAGRSSLDLVPRMGHAFDPHGIPTLLKAVAWVVGLNPQPAT
jgi:alpha-beta hydrolase superfamily lysophospholipase